MVISEWKKRSELPFFVFPLNKRSPSTKKPRDILPAELSLCYDFRTAPKALFSSKSSALSFQNSLSKNTSSHVEHSQQSLLHSPHSCTQNFPKKKEVQQMVQEKKDIQQGRIALVPHRIKVAKAQASGVVDFRLTFPSHDNLWSLFFFWKAKVFGINFL